MKIFQITLRATTDFHTAGGSQGSTVDYLRDTSGLPYIPGSHIKGIMRTEAERIVRSVYDIKCWITGDVDKMDADSEKNKREVVTCSESKNGKYACDVCPLFGAPNNDGGNGYIEGKIRVMDFRADRENNGFRMHVSIDRDKLSKNDGGLFRTKVVSSGTRFTGHIITKDLSESEMRLLKASIHSMCHYGIGGERSRGLGSFELDGDIMEISPEDLAKGGVL